MGTLPKITPDDSAGIFMGSGALDYPWYRDVDLVGIDFRNQSADDWHVTLTHYDPDHDENVAECRIDHASIMRAVRAIADGKVESVLKDGRTAKECRALIFKGPDEVDFDGPMADNVIQVAAFGRVFYS